MNVLLIHPKFPDTFWSFSYALRFIGKKVAFPPLGLITVAALLPATWSLRLVDVNVDDLTDDDLAWADMAFLSAMAVQRKSTAAIIARCHGRGLTIVAGGPLFTAQPDVFGQVDHLVLDEAEMTLPVFVADLENGCPQKIYRANGYPDVHQTPIPLWHLIHMNRYASLNIQYSRGCPFDCDFCNITSLFGSRPRTKTPRQVLAECRKVHNKNRDMLLDVKKIHRSGLQVMGGFIVGFDSDTPSIFQRQIDFIQQSGIVTAMVGMLQAPPGTRLFDRLVGERRVCTDFSGDNVDGRTSIIPAMGLDHLIDGYRAIMRQSYSPRKYYQRIRSILKDLKAPAATVPIDWQRFLAFFRACLRLGVLGKARFQYWYLLIWTLARRPRLLPLAVTFTICGYHYRRICELHIL